jgi:hypothetical protein
MELSILLPPNREAGRKQKSRRHFQNIFLHTSRRVKNKHKFFSSVTTASSTDVVGNEFRAVVVVVVLAQDFVRAWVYVHKTTARIEDKSFGDWRLSKINKTQRQIGNSLLFLNTMWTERDDDAGLPPNVNKKEKAKSQTEQK